MQIVDSESKFCKKCDETLVLENGLVYYADNQAYYQCDDGYRIDGTVNRNCGKLSNWTLPEPVCKRRNDGIFVN